MGSNGENVAGQQVTDFWSAVLFRKNPAAVDGAPLKEVLESNGRVGKSDKSGKGPGRGQFRTGGRDYVFPRYRHV